VVVERLGQRTLPPRHERQAHQLRDE